MCAELEVALNVRNQSYHRPPFCTVFTARRNARIASAVLATAIPPARPSVRLSVCPIAARCKNEAVSTIYRPFGLFVAVLIR